MSRRLALVELLPGSVRQQVRAGKIAAHVAMKYLVRMAAAWRDASPAVRERILAAPDLFLKVLAAGGAIRLRLELITGSGHGPDHRDARRPP